MKREVITKGKTIDDAINAAALELGVDRDDMSVEIIDTPFKGFLGIGSTPAKIKATVGEDDEINEILTAAKPSVKNNKPKTEEKKPVEKKPVEKKQFDKKPYDKKKNNAPRKPQPKPSQPKQYDDEKAPTEEELNAAAKQAKEFVEKTIQLMGITDYDMKVTTSGKTVHISLNGKNMGMLIGKRGDTMYAIQYLTSLAVNKEDGQFARIELDVENYREKRTAALEKLAVRTAEKVLKTRRNVTLECMQAYERRVIHSTLQNYNGVFTRSIGEEPYRKVVVYFDRNSNK